MMDLCALHAHVVLALPALDGTNRGSQILKAPLMSVQVHSFSHYFRPTWRSGTVAVLRWHVEVAQGFLPHV